MNQPEALWEPSEESKRESRVGRYLTWLERRRGLRFDRYDELWRWSTTDLPGFWSSVWDYFELRSATPYEDVLAGDEIAETRWFVGATLNYAERALASTGSDVAIFGHSQTRPAIELSFDELREQVARARRGLKRLGVGRGDRVVAYMPNVPEAVIAFLATASLGAVWSSCSPEFGAVNVAHRFSQLDPKVLIAVDGYRYGSKVVERLTEVATLRKRLPTVSQVILLPYLDEAADLPHGYIPWLELVAEMGELAVDAVPFDHPLYVLYSSGTTGLPKAIIHGHGNILIEHLKSIVLQNDVAPGDVMLSVASTAWMVWNYLVSGLAARASIVCFDGNPLYPDLHTPWRLLAETDATYCGLSAAYLTACRKADLHPGDEHDLSRLRLISSTGSPLPAGAWRWVYEAVKSDLMLYSGSGGTDICSGFITGSPLLPVRAGEMACRALGARVEAFDASGRPLVGKKGELVVTAPMPSMPVGLWNDPDRSRYRATYFEVFPGIWRHGDWITITERGTCVISGRSDATLKRGGVRLGSGEFYEVLDTMAGVSDSLVVHLPDPDGGPGLLVLLIAVDDIGVIDAELERRIRTRLRQQLSPRHVPDAIIGVSRLPRTLTGKKLEVPVKRLLMGEQPEAVIDRDAITNPDALDAIMALAPSIGRLTPPA